VKECTTRTLIREGHNLSEDPDVVPSGGCEACDDPFCCHFIGPVCGCDSSECVDKRR
jgi:hypothetical protein